MIPLIVSLTAMFIWLLKETDWLRVNLMPQPIIHKPKHKWQFAKYSDNALMMRDRCYVGNCQECRKDNDHWITWRIPARTVKVFGSTINFKEGCNLYRAKLLSDIIKAQKSKAITHYPSSHLSSLQKAKSWQWYERQFGEPTMELLVDGKTIANINGDYKHGTISKALKPYTTKARVGRRTVTWSFGEADRVKTQEV